LKGKASPPNALKDEALTIKAKGDHVQIISVKNWLKTRQRFTVSWQFEAEAPFIIVNGANTIDVNEDCTKDYK